MLDGLLKDQVRSDPTIAGMLTSYNGKPAFFYQKSPPDTDREWSKPCYPRADYNIDMRYDPERKVSGVLSVNIWCSSESNAMPEDIEKQLVELISGTFYTATDKVTVYASWNRSDAFVFESRTQNNTSIPEVFGVSIQFDLTLFPDQITTAPDPLQGLNLWIKMFSAKMHVIAFDDIPAIWKPTDNQPAIYWRFADATSDNRQSYAVNWYNGTFAGHVFTSSVTERNKWIKAIVEEMQLKGEVVLADKSPMFINRIAFKPSADPLREGQIAITGNYGVLAQHRKEHAEMAMEQFKLSYGGASGKE